MSNQEQPIEMENLEQEPEDFGVKTFSVGGKPMELKFTAAARFRLFKSMTPEEIQAYVATETFKLQAITLLILGKKALTQSIDQILDDFDEIGLMDDEVNAIYSWVLKRTLNFMLKEADEAANQLKKMLPKVNELSNTLSSFQD